MRSSESKESQCQSHAFATSYLEIFSSWKSPLEGSVLLPIIAGFDIHWKWRWNDQARRTIEDETGYENVRCFSSETVAYTCETSIYTSPNWAPLIGSWDNTSILFSIAFFFVCVEKNNIGCPGYFVPRCGTYLSWRTVRASQSLELGLIP